MKSCEIFLLLKIRTMATNFSPCKGSYVLNHFPSNVMFAMNGFTYQPVERYRAIMAVLFWHSHAPIMSIFIPCLEWRDIFFALSISLSVCFLAHLNTTCSRGACRVVRCPSCVVNNFFKHLLLPNRWANLDQTWQECSLGGPLQKFFTEFDSIKNSGYHGNEIEFFK